jgi:mannosyltransferase
MNWVDALKRLRAADPRATLAPLLASLKPGQQLLFVRPLTEGAQNWEAPWTQLVRRRSAQWGALISADHSLVPVAWAPHNYRGACCVADSAVLYRKVS